MRAHGQTPGPGERPRRAGALAGLFGGVAGVPVLLWTGAAASLADALVGPSWLILLLYCGVALLAGVGYGWIFQRAANDRRGGWLFGIAYGFLLWMIGPVTILQAIQGRPLATGTAAMGVLLANLVFGLGLGILFPSMHGVVRRRLTDTLTAPTPWTSSR